MDFAFNASALAAGAEINFGDTVNTIPSLGSLMLSPDGGQGRTAISNYYSQELKIADAETRVAGRKFVDKNERRFGTWTSVVLRGVSIFDTVHVGEMGTTLSSTRGLDPADDDHEFDLHIWFHNVRIGDRKVQIRIDESLRTMKRYRDLQALLQRRGAADALAKRHDADPAAAKRVAADLTKFVSGRMPVCIPLVERIEGWEHEALATIRVKGLGTFRFGELLIKPGQRRINLIRANFGSGSANEPRLLEARSGGDTDELPTDSGKPPIPDGGSMILGSGEGNGTPIGP